MTEESVRQEDVRVIRISDYSTDWPAAYDLEAQKLTRVFGEQLAGIHHIGSTAVPGLPAKPVIDILVEVSEIEKVDELNQLMEKLGYEAWGENGISNRRFFPKGRNRRSHHVHVFPAGHSEVLRHLRFRDYMRAYPDEARAYADLKQELAGKHPHDIDSYCDGKNAFIHEIDCRAAEWANALGSAAGDNV
jgi:GrpB-like predicted nucleotidyltransferase (UPF0157 family)